VTVHGGDGFGVGVVLGGEINFSGKGVQGVFRQGWDRLLAMNELVIKGKVTYIPYAMILQHYLRRKKCLTP
jgi:hypothetical protein